MVSTTLHQKLPILIIIMSRLWLTAETGHLLLFLTFYEVHALDYKARKKCSYGSYACDTGKVQVACPRGIRRLSHGNVRIPRISPLPAFAQCM